VAVAVDAIEPGTSPPDAAATFTLAYGDEGRLHLTATAVIDAASVTVGPPATAAPGSALSAPAPTKPAPSPQTGNWDAVLDIDLPLRVRFGATEMSIRALSTLGPGSIVDMGRAPDEPVEILVCGRVVARAEVVVVDGNYGVRVTDLLSASERVRALEGQW
jgi:flagellar motor switch protein FliN/FliY